MKLNSTCATNRLMDVDTWTKETIATISEVVLKGDRPFPTLYCILEKKDDFGIVSAPVVGDIVDLEPFIRNVVAKGDCSAVCFIHNPEPNTIFFSIETPANYLFYLCECNLKSVKWSSEIIPKGDKRAHNLKQFLFDSVH